jgi:hypothetical protein
MYEHEIAEHLSRSKPRPSWRKRLLVGILILLPCCVAAPYVYFIVAANQQYQQAVAEADQLDPGWSIFELEQKRAIIPDAENSGLVLIAAKSRMPPNWPIWNHWQAPESQKHSQEELRTLQESFADLRPCVQLDGRQTAVLREELQRAEKAVTTARQVANLAHGRYPIHYTKDFISTLLPHVQDTRIMGILLDYDVLLRIQDGDMDGALTSCRAILNCGRSIGDEPTLMGMLVRLALDDAAIKELERILAQGQPSGAALSAMQHALEDEAAEPLLLIGVRGERSMIDAALQAIQDGDLDPRYADAILAGGGKGGFPGSAQLLRIPGMVKSIRTTLLKLNNRLVEIAKLPVEQQSGALKELDATIKNLPEFTRPWTTHIQVAEAFYRVQARLHSAIVSIAVEHYRQVHNRWPATLADLVPAGLAQVPLDPFDGAALRYRRLEDGVVIYSIGPDGKDNGGKLDKTRLEGSDVGLRLWDVPQRRQLPNQTTNDKKE